MSDADRSQQFELLVKGIADYAIFMLDPAGRVKTWNVGAERLKGYSEAEIVGESYARFYTPEDLAAGHHTRLLEQARREGQVEDLGWRVRKDGTRFWADVVITAIRDASGTIVGFGKVTRDLTERKRLEDAVAAHTEALQAANEELAMQQEELALQADALRAADKLKDQFLSILSHELRTPLNAVLGFASVVADEVAGPLNPTQHAYLGKILGGTDVLLGLIDDLLDMSRIQAGKFSIAASEGDLGPVIRRVEADMEALATRKGQQVTVAVADDLPRVVFDPQRVAQVLTNLLGNAIKFTPPAGTIAVRAMRAGDGVRVEVEDDGPGVPTAQQPHLFEPFFQVDSSYTRAAGGTGLGLSIARALVEAHGGRIGLQGAEGGGSVFWFELPPAGPGPA